MEPQGSPQKGCMRASVLQAERRLRSEGTPHQKSAGYCSPPFPFSVFPPPAALRLKLSELWHGCKDVFIKGRTRFLTISELLGVMYQVTNSLNCMSGLKTDSLRFPKKLHS
jgi:hypothetical protein